MRILKVLLLLTFLFFLNSCVALAPVMETYRQMGVSEADRMQLLEQRVREFHDSIYWGRPHTALQLSDESARPDLRRRVRDRRRKEKLVDSKVDFVEFDDDAYEAKVDVLIRFYRVPNYVVKERVETQDWRFSTVSGWMYFGTEKEEILETIS